MPATRRSTRSILFPGSPAVPSSVTRLAKDEKWTISNERVFMEDLVYKRLTLFLTVAGAVTTGAITLRSTPEICIPLLMLGTVLCWVLQQTVHRAQLKLDIILEILFTDDTHPTGYINRVLNDEGRVRWVGYLVPSAVCILLSAATLAEIAFYTGLIPVKA